MRLWKFIHEVTSIIQFEFSDNYSCMQQNSMRNVESAQKRKMHVELELLLLQQFLSHSSMFHWKDNFSTIVWRMTTAERARAVGLLQECVSLMRPVCISNKTPIVKTNQQLAYLWISSFRVVFFLQNDCDLWYWKWLQNGLTLADG